MQLDQETNISLGDHMTRTNEIISSSNWEQQLLATFTHRIRAVSLTPHLPLFFLNLLTYEHFRKSRESCNQLSAAQISEFSDS